MKARLLRKVLNNTDYSISNHDEYIAVGSPLCHNLISVDKKTMAVKYALDAFKKGREAIRNQELGFIWDKLHDLISSGEINDIINGKDEIENPLPVFTVVGGQLIESVTDKYGWPNTDDNGVCMHDNTHFPTKEQAIDYGIRENEIGAEIYKNRVSELMQEIEKARTEAEKYFSRAASLREMKNEIADQLNNPGNE
jgi:hypothetical protein